MSAFRAHYYQTDDGLTLYARDYPGPSVGAPVVLCLHGLTRNSRDFQDLAIDLARYFRVLVPEQRGRGLSDYDTDSAHYTILQYVQDMTHLLRSLKIDRISVVGTSMGGLMTFALNALHPGLIARAVINDIGPEIAPQGLARIKSYVGAAGPFDDWDAARNYIKTISAEIFPKWSAQQWSDFAKQSYIERNGKIVIDYDPGIIEPLQVDTGDAETETLWAMFDALAHVPLLLVRGELTDLLSEKCVAEMRRRHQHLTVLTVPDVGHAPMLNEPGVSAAIQSFLTS
jgi:pimeloyl-ACP methyl ester carboxylesterase